MPKSKKKKRQDFQKVKLKVGKRLPKGDNVTNLSFKTRQIQLTQRIKDDNGQDLVTKNKQNVQDLLRQCDHHSSSSRVSAVMGLRELWLNNYADMMVPTNVHGYAALLKKLSSLLIDSEATVRHAVVNLMKLILHKITKSSPSDTAQSDRLLGGSLFAHLHAFLCCAMNHIHEDVRLDALLLYDALLEACPALVVQQTGEMLKNLVGLLAGPSHLGSQGDTTTQRLSLNPESRLPVMVFRVRVLSRIKRTLMAALEDSSSSANSDAQASQNVWSLHNDHVDSRRNQNTMIVSRQITHRFSQIAGGSSHELDDYITNGLSLKSFMRQCIPVLCQCWREAKADSDTHDSVSLLTSSALEVVSLVVSVIELLFVLSSSGRRKGNVGETISNHLVPPEILTKNYLASLEQLLMAGFPYSAQLEASAAKKKANKKKDKDSGIQTHAAVQTSLTALNLGICDIMCCFCLDPNISFSNKRLKKISHHIVLAIKEAPNVEQCKMIVRMTENVFSNPNTADCFVKVYKLALKWYMKAKSKSAQKKVLYDMFASLGSKWDGWSKLHCEDSPQHHFVYQHNERIEETLVEFFKSLPGLALTAHSLRDQSWTLDILKLMSHGHVRLHDISFENQLNGVLDSEQGLFTSTNEQIQQRVCTALSRRTQFTKENLKQLLNLIRCPPEKPVVCARRSMSCVSHALFAAFANIRTVVPLTSQIEFNKMSKENHQQLSDYLRFLFSLLIGFTGEDLESISPQNTEQGAGINWFCIDFTTTEEQLLRHIEISNVVAREIAGFTLPAQPGKGYKDIFTFITNFEHFWTQTFCNRKRMHALTVIGLVHLLMQTSQPHRHEKAGPGLVSLAALSLASLLAALYNPDTISGMASSVSWQIKAELTCLLASLSTVGSSVLDKVMESLAGRATGTLGGSEVERQAAKSAKDFLLTDETLRHKLKV